MYCFDDLTFEPLFKNLSLNLEKDKLHLLTGQNGSGKTTLLRLIRDDDRRVCLVDQKFDQMIADQFSFEDNLRFATLSTIPLPWFFSQKRVAIPPFITRFGIDLKREARILSGGQRQILALLMILQRKPSLLLLDEPTAALDATNAKMVFEFLKEAKITALVVCHDQHLANQYRTGDAFHLDVDEEGGRQLISSNVPKSRM